MDFRYDADRTGCIYATQSTKKETKELRRPRLPSMQLIACEIPTERDRRQEYQDDYCAIMLDVKPITRSKRLSIEQKSRGGSPPRPIGGSIGHDAARRRMTEAGKVVGESTEIGSESFWWVRYAHRLRQCVRSGNPIEKNDV
jgi:hypothetical protein